MIKIALLLTGNELMSGCTLDSNSATIAQQVSKHGFYIAEKITIGDNPELLAEKLRIVKTLYPICIVNGGLGPTSDDTTAQAASRAFQQPLQVHPKAQEHLEQFSQQYQIPLNQANLKQAWLPKNAVTLPNSHGTALGFSYQETGCLYYFTPGVPEELEPMMTQSILPDLVQRFSPSLTLHSIQFSIFGIGESILQTQIDQALSKELLKNLNLSTRVHSSGVVSLQVSSTENPRRVQQAHQLLQESLQEWILAEKELSLEENIVTLLREQQKTLGIAESCTGGLLSSKITSIGGSSQCFLGGIISYSKAMKQQQLKM